jgi:hypothetical protein
LQGNNKIRGTLGLTLNLGPVKLNGDYSMATQSIFTVGLGLGFNEIVKDSNPPSIAFRIAGDSEPASERIFVVIRIKATITVAYDVESDIGL